MGGWRRLQGSNRASPPEAGRGDATASIAVPRGGLRRGFVRHERPISPGARRAAAQEGRNILSDRRLAGPEFPADGLGMRTEPAASNRRAPTIRHGTVLKSDHGGGVTQRGGRLAWISLAPTQLADAVRGVGDGRQGLIETASQITWKLSMRICIRSTCPGRNVCEFAHSLAGSTEPPAPRRRQEEAAALRQDTRCRQVARWRVARRRWAFAGPADRVTRQRPTELAWRRRTSPHHRLPASEARTVPPSAATPPPPRPAPADTNQLDPTGLPASPRRPRALRPDSPADTPASPATPKVAGCR